MALEGISGAPWHPQTHLRARNHRLSDKAAWASSLQRTAWPGVRGKQGLHAGGVGDPRPGPYLSESGLTGAFSGGRAMGK